MPSLIYNGNGHHAAVTGRKTAVLQQGNGYTSSSTERKPELLDKFLAAHTELQAYK